MTRQELEAKWPRSQFEEIKARHHFQSSSTYEDYLKMRREQEEIAEEGRLLGLTGDEPPELTEEDIAIFDRNWAELGREIELKRRMELEAKWPRAQFEEFKAKGHFHPDTTYEEYLDTRREQEEIAEEGRRLGLTGDEPPKLTEEDEAILDRVWAKQTREQEQVREELAA
jgi:5-methylcytosine-specific restriction endonuclease McrBC GTP-binding regulatory subunit McrB